MAMTINSTVGDNLTSSQIEDRRPTGKQADIRMIASQSEDHL